VLLLMKTKDREPNRNENKSKHATEIVIALTLGGVEKDSRGAVISLSRRGKIQKKKERDTATRTHFASIAALQVIKKGAKGP